MRGASGGSVGRQSLGVQPFSWSQKGKNMGGERGRTNDADDPSGRFEGRVDVGSAGTFDG